MATCPKCHAEVPNEAKFCSNCAEPLPKKNNGLVGKRINNKYIVTKKLAEGGMGEVYVAKQVALGQEVAIKKLHAELCKNQNLVDRFITEARAYGKISHPNAVKVHDLLNVNGELCIIMEYVKGKTLTSYIEEGFVFTQRQILEIGTQVASALATAHQAGIIHRDLKTENIMLLENVARKFSAKILDFGIAKVRDAPTDGETKEGVILGTPEFMSPEQCYGSKQIDSRSDIYSYGVILYVMVANRLPFHSETKLGILGQHINMAPPPLTRINGKAVSAALEALIMKCLQKNPDDRYQSFAEVIADIDHIQEGEPLEFAQLLREDNTELSGIYSIESLKTVSSEPAPSEAELRALANADAEAPQQADDAEDDATNEDEDDDEPLDSVEEAEPVEPPKAEKKVEPKTEAKPKAETKPAPKRSDSDADDDDEAKESGVFKMSVSEPRESIIGLSLGSVNIDDDDDDDDDERPDRKRSSSSVPVVIVLVILAAAAAVFFIMDPLGVLNKDEAKQEVVEQTPTPVEAEAPTPAEPEQPVEAAPAEPEEPTIAASQALSHDVLMRGVWRASLNTVEAKLYAGNLDQAKAQLAEISANKDLFGEADVQRLNGYIERHADYTFKLDAAVAAQKKMNCGSIKSLLDSLPAEATGMRTKIDKIQKSCSRAQEAPPSML